MMRVVSFGEVLLRLASPGYARLFQKDSLDVTFCGSEANVAVSLALFGVDSIFVTKLPDNEVGRAAVNSMRYFGVDISKVIYGDGRMGLYYLEKGASQRPSKIIYDRSYSTISMAKRKDFNWCSIFQGVGWFHWTGIDPALGGELAEICEEACHIAKKMKIKISCDLNYRKNLWTIEKAQETMDKLMPYVDVCVANEEDADKVLGIKLKNNNIGLGRLNETEYQYVAKEICEKYGCEKAAITLRESNSASRNGWSGILYDSLEKEVYYSQKYEMQIVDRVGGGDSFTAGIIYCLLNGKGNQYVVEFATAASCLKHTIEGDFNRISVDEVEYLIKSGGHGRVIR